jgi:phospholipid-binding lipoprotein MlaA
MRYTFKQPYIGTPLFSAILLALSGCASTPEPAAPAVAQTPSDPYENFNRSVYDFNNKVDSNVIKPVADGYTAVTPEPVRNSVSNFFDNLKGINVTLNDFLQGKADQGASDLGRFLTNTTIGVGGIFDVASDLGMERHNEDFGQTLATWGVDPGPYLVLPLLGPSSARDGVGSIFDRAVNPGTYVPGPTVIESVNARVSADPAIKVSQEAVDPYIFVREGYLQHRENLAKDGKTDAESYEKDLDEQLSSDSKSQPAAKAASGTAGAEFEQTTLSFDQTAQEFEEASQKLDRLEHQKHRRHHKAKQHQRKSTPSLQLLPQ